METVENNDHPILYYAVLALLAWLPIPLGSNRAWAWFLMAAGASAILGLWLIQYLRRPCRLPEALRSARIPLILLGLWLLYIVFQTVPIGNWLLNVISPAAYELQGYTQGTDTAAPMAITVDAGATWVEFLKYQSYVALFILVLVLVDNPRRLRVLALTLVVIGVLEAAFGLTAHFLSWDVLGWEPQTAKAGAVPVRGTYVNRNHFAPYMGMMLALGLGLLLSRLRPARSYSGWRIRLTAWLENMLEARMRLAVGLAIMFAALFLSTSRGGNGSFMAALVLVLVLGLIFKGRGSPDARLAPIVGGIVLFAAIWMGFGGLDERLVQTDITKDERAVQWASSWDLASDYIFVGNGAGNYAVSFSLYKGDKLRPLLYDHAHNDYLELLAEQGIVGAALLGSAVLVLLAKIIAAYRRRHDLLMRGMLFASLVGTLTLLLHGTVSFNFRIPANAAYFFVLLGIGIVAATLPHTHPRKAERPPSNQRAESREQKAGSSERRAASR